MGTARSRIDRIYSNHYVTDQLDRHYSCAALLWTSWSAHRPLSFSRICPTHGAKSRPLPQAPLDHPDWTRRVSLEYQEICSLDALSGNPLRRLVLMKRAVRTVTYRMHKEGVVGNAERKDDQLGWTLSFIRAAEEVNLSRMASCARSYPSLATYIHHDDPNARSSAGMAKLREHALQLAKDAISDEMAELRRMSLEPNSAILWQKKEHILTKLKRTRPGQTSSLNAVQTDDGDVSTDPAIIAKALQAHWSKIFSSRPIDSNLLARWLDSLPSLRLPDVSATNADTSEPTRANQHGRRHTDRTHLTDQPMDRWNINREDIEEAIKVAGKTSPGPDKLPYSAWKQLGALGVDTLWAATQDLSTDEANQLLQDAYWDEADDGTHNFNLGNLVCLPKKPSGHHDDVGEYFTSEATRALSIVNTDNRIVANAARLKWEPVLGAWTSQM